MAEVKELAHAMDADMVIFDNGLSPSQQRVLSEDLGVSVLDRSALILDIFAQRARTREGRLQVELAQYKYLLPRLMGMWTHLERQEGAIGTRGPGETQLESDRRHIRRKISKLEEELKDVRRVRATQRERRIKNEVPVVAIVGYTNAGNPPCSTGSPGRPSRPMTGCSTPWTPPPAPGDLRHLHGAHLRHGGLYPQAAPPSGGGLQGHPGGAGYADLLLHVIDASNPEWRDQTAVVEDLIRELGPNRPPAWMFSTNATGIWGTSGPTGRTSSPSPPGPARGCPNCWPPSAGGWTTAPAG